MFPMTDRFRILVTDRAWPDTAIEQSIASTIGARIVEPGSTSEEALVEAAATVDAIATNWAKVTERVIRAAVRCKVISRFGIGIDNIAVQTATELRIPVTNCPDYCISEVSDHALGLLLACARRICLFQGRIKKGEYDSTSPIPMQRLSGQTLGLLGLGHIARALVPKAQVLGLRIIAHTTRGCDYGTGITMVSFEELLSQSDFLSLHAPLTPATSRIINEKSLSQMRPSSYLINTSRGGLVDHDALFQALRHSVIAGAALDVFDPEPPDLNHPLFSDDRVIATPHAAFISAQSLEQLRSETIQNVVAVLTGRRPKNVINPQIETKT